MTYDSLILLAGSGMSADCGLPTFRSTGGYWKGDTRYEDIANPYSFRSDPETGWDFYEARRKLYCVAEPHAGHRALVDLAREKKVFVLTTNVDGLFQRAGLVDVSEIHGSIHHNQCQDACTRNRWPASEGKQCPHCGKIARPNVCMFHDPWWVSEAYQWQEKRFNHWLKEISKPLIVEVGVGKALPTLRLRAKKLGEQFQQPVVRINTEDGDIRFRAERTLPELIKNFYKE